MKPILLPVPHRQQQDRGECLVACAVMTMSYIDIPIPYKRLFTLLQVKKRVGAFAPNIRKLERFGIRVIYQQGTLDELYDHLANNRPSIAFVKTGELPYWNVSTYHALVVIGLDEEFVYLNDPAFAVAPMQVSHGDFELAWQERDEYYAALIK